MPHTLDLRLLDRFNRLADATIADGLCEVTLGRVALSLSESHVNFINIRGSDVLIMNVELLVLGVLCKCILYVTPLLVLVRSISVGGFFNH